MLPEDPTQGSAFEFAASSEDERGFTTSPPPDVTNPDGSPVDVETNLLNEL